MSVFLPGLRGFAYGVSEAVVAPHTLQRPEMCTNADFCVSEGA